MIHLEANPRTRENLVDFGPWDWCQAHSGQIYKFRDEFKSMMGRCYDYLYKRPQKAKGKFGV